MNLLMAEDLKPVRDRLSSYLADDADVDLRFVDQSAAQLLQAIAIWHPDVVILDTHVRGGTALGLLEELKYEWPDISVVVSSLDFEPWRRKTFLARGAAFVFHKKVRWEELMAFLDEFRSRTTTAPPEARIAPVTQSL